MKSKSFWTPYYLIHRALDKYYQYQNPTDPWLTPTAIMILNAWLKTSDIGFEYGSGRSTIWFANRVQWLTSIEHQSPWYQSVKDSLENQKIHNVTYHLSPLNNPTAKNGNEETTHLSYLADQADDSLDFILVDGVMRDHIAILAIAKIKIGGLIILDNANLHLPSDSRSPNSIHLGQQPATALWEQFLHRTGDWRKIWTTNGVFDTALFFKPS